MPNTILKTKLKSKTITLQWIPGHCGIEDNENTSSLAKKGQTVCKPSSDPYPFTLQKPKSTNQQETMYISCR